MQPFIRSRRRSQKGGPNKENSCKLIGPGDGQADVTREYQYANHDDQNSQADSCQNSDHSGQSFNHSTHYNSPHPWCLINDSTLTSSFFYIITASRRRCSWRTSPSLKPHQPTPVLSGVIGLLSLPALRSGPIVQKRRSLEPHPPPRVSNAYQGRRI